MKRRSVLDHSPLAPGDVLTAFLRGYVEAGNKPALTLKMSKGGKSVSAARLHNEEYLPSVPRPPELMDGGADGAAGGKPQVVSFEDEADGGAPPPARKNANRRPPSADDAAPRGHPAALELNAVREANLRVVFEHFSECGPSGEEIPLSEFNKMLIALGMLPEDDPDTPEDERFVEGLPSNHRLTVVDATLLFDKADVDAGRALGKGRNHKLSFKETVTALHEACCVWFLGRDRPTARRPEHIANERRAFAEFCDGVVARAAQTFGQRVDPHVEMMRLPRCRAALMRYAPNLKAIFDHYAAADQTNIDTGSAAAVQHANASLNIKELEEVLRDFEVLPQLITGRELTRVFRFANAADEGDEFFNDLNLREFVDCIGRVGLTIGERLYGRLLNGAGQGGPPGAPPGVAPAAERPLPKEMVLMRKFFAALPGESARAHIAQLLKACAHGGKDASTRTNVTREAAPSPASMGAGLLPEDSVSSIDPWFAEEARVRLRRSTNLAAPPPASRRPRYSSPNKSAKRLAPGGFAGIQADVAHFGAASRAQRLESVLSDALDAAVASTVAASPDAPTPSALERGLRSALEESVRQSTVLNLGRRTPVQARGGSIEPVQLEFATASKADALAPSSGAVASSPPVGPAGDAPAAAPAPAPAPAAPPPWFARQLRRDGRGTCLQSPVLLV